MSIPSHSKPRLRVLRKGGWLDAILFGLLFTCGTIFVLSLLTSTFKKSLRGMVWDELFNQTSAVVDGLRASGLDVPMGKEVDPEKLQEYLRSIRLNNEDLMAVCLVVPQGDALKVVSQAGLFGQALLSQQDGRLLSLVRSAQGQRSPVFSEWDFVARETVPLFTELVEAPEFTAQSVRMRSELDPNPPVVVLFYDAARIQKEFIAIDDLRASTIAISILLATILSFFIRYRSLQRQDAIDQRLAAVNLLSRRDEILAAVAAAADDLMAPGNQEEALKKLLGLLRNTANTEVVYLSMNTSTGRAPGMPLDSVVIGQMPSRGDAIVCAELEKQELREWKELLFQNRYVQVDLDPSGDLGAFLRSKGHHFPLLLPLIFEGRLIGLLVLDREEMDEAWDPGLLDTLKLVADLAAAAWVRREQETKLLETSKMQALGRMAGGVAHEFNNLLHIIAGNAQRLIDEMGDGHPSPVAPERILEASSRGRKIVEQLLGAARQTRPDLKAGDLNKLVLQTVELAKPALRKSVEIIVKERQKLPPVLMDMAQIQQVILNLLINANDAVPEKGRIEVILGLRQEWSEEPENPMVYCEIRDNGPGIPEEAMSHIFEPFFTTKEPGHGTGLGLPTSRGIIEQHQGRLVARNLVSVGAAFTMYLPASNASVRPSEVLRTREQAEFASKGLVLVADDEALCREVLIDTLAEAGFSCVSAADGTEAILFAREKGREISWVFTDWTMPGIRGRELVSELRRLLPGARMVVTTGYAIRREDHPDIDAVVQKPFTGDELFARMRELEGGKS